MQATFSQSEEVFYRSHITIKLVIHTLQDHKDYSSWEFTYAGPHEEGSEWDQTDSESSDKHAKSHSDKSATQNKAGKPDTWCMWIAFNP